VHHLAGDIAALRGLDDEVEIPIGHLGQGEVAARVRGGGGEHLRRAQVGDADHHPCHRRLAVVPEHPAAEHPPPLARRDRRGGGGGGGGGGLGGSLGMQRRRCGEEDRKNRGQ